MNIIRDHHNKVSSIICILVPIEIHNLSTKVKMTVMKVVDFTTLDIDKDRSSDALSGMAYKRQKIALSEPVREHRGVCALCIQFETLQRDTTVSMSNLHTLLQNVKYIVHLRIARSCINEVSGIQNGFAFVHFENTKLGVKSAMHAGQALSALKSKVVAYLGKVIISHDPVVLVIRGELYLFSPSTYGSISQLLLLSNYDCRHSYSSNGSTYLRDDPASHTCICDTVDDDEYPTSLQI